MALLLPSGGVVQAVLSEPIEEAAFERACARASPDNPLPVEVALGEYATERYAFTGCSLRLPPTEEGVRLTKFRRIECV